MVDGWLYPLTLVTTLGCALMAGAFFVFSVMVMTGLGRLPASEGIAAMQAINLAAIRPGFLSVFMGTTGASLVLAVAAVVSWGEAGATTVLAGCALYLVGTFGLTAGYHVPRNEALATVEPGTDGATESWHRYLVEWTRWNHVRAFASLAACLALVLAL